MSIEIKGVTIGEDGPKICVPIMGKSKDEIYRQCEQAAGDHPDLIEWRSDFYEDVMDENSVLKILQHLSEMIPNIPILFTFRSAGEGGNREINTEDYKRLLLAVTRQKKADLTDVEVFRKDLNAGGLITKIHHLNGKVIASHHNFRLTYQTEQMIDILEKMEELGADILKLAMMPQSPEDVLHLFEATLRMSKKATKPVVTMSMDKLGRISRVGGGTFGSAITFASVTGASAPGQIPIDELRTILSNLQ